MEYLRDYASSSNLHGLKYIGERERTVTEKIFWTVTFAISVFLCGGLIRKVWIKWDQTPVIVTFAENTTPVWQIPYPAVTICLETKVMQTVYNFTHFYESYYNFKNESVFLSDKEIQTFEDVSVVCDDHLAPPNGNKTRNRTVLINTIREVSPLNVEDVFVNCSWLKHHLLDCNELFSPIMTDDGQCFTFNMIGAEDLLRTENVHKDYAYLESRSSMSSWNLENGYSPQTPLNTYPHRGRAYGLKSGLRFILVASKKDMDYSCSGAVQGFTVQLHNPAEMPRLSQQYFRSPLSQEVLVAVKPKMMTTSEGLRPYDPTRRQCYFPSERYLLYYKVYTQANCEMECLTNFTNARCGCVHFGMPHGPDIKVCSAGNMACLKEAQLELLTLEMQSELASPDVDASVGAAREVALQCQCLQACTYLEYEAETSQADYDVQAVEKAYNVDTSDENMLYARVVIFFKEAQFITSRRSELYGQTDFLANCGGLLGLFMGFSILSLAEILYFLTLRLCCLVLKRRRDPTKADNRLNMKTA